jgi:hypothetical protein
MTVGEAGGTTPAQAMDYISQEREDKEMHMVFNTDVSGLRLGYRTPGCPHG